LSLMAAAQGNQADQTHSMSRAWKDFQKRSRLQEASVALNALSLQVAQTFEPILNFAAGGATGLTHLAQRHRTGTKIAVGSAATMLAALGVARFLGFGSSLAGRLSGGLGSGLVRANAIQAAMSSSGVLGSAPQNPMYVVVVGQLFNPNSRPDSRTPGKGFGGGATQFGKKAMPWLEGAAAEGVLAGGASAGMLVGAGIVAPLAILGGAAYFGNKYGGKGAKHNAIEQVMAANRERSMPGSVAGPLDGANGQAYGVLDVNINHPDGTKERKRVKVPVNYFPRGVVPTYRGRAGNSQRGK
jgi:hypothetical protein